MAASRTSFEKGKSGNPKGRPPKSRTLTAILESAGSKKVLQDYNESPDRTRRMVALLIDGLCYGAKPSAKMPPKHE